MLGYTRRQQTFTFSSTHCAVHKKIQFQTMRQEIYQNIVEGNGTKENGKVCNGLLIHGA